MNELIKPGLDLIPKDKEGNPKYVDLQSYATLINHKPKSAWIATNKFSQNAKYIPIGIIEELLREVYPFWECQQNGQPQILGNSIVISVNLRVFHPLLNTWLNYPGVGAVPIEVEKGAHPTDFTKINSKALHKNVPAALSFAINNAAKKIGKLFGSHLNRKEELS